MKRLLLAASLVAAALACGKVNERGACSAATDCAVGEYCARTPDGNVCWPDSTGPSVALSSAGCGAAGCKRDGVLDVQATAADPDSGILSVTATLTLGADQHTFALPAEAGAYHGQLDLSAIPFPYFATTGTIAVTAENGSRLTATTGPEAAPAITRLRWAVAVNPSTGIIPTAPAVELDGTVLVGGSDGSLYFVPGGDPTARHGVNVAASAIAQAPSVGTSAVWVASGTKVLGVSSTDGSVLNGVGLDVEGTAVGPLATSVGLTPEVAFAASSGGRLWTVTASATANGYIVKTGLYDPFTSGAIANGSGFVTGVTDPIGGGNATLRDFVYDGALTPGWTYPLGDVVATPLAIDAAGDVWSGSADLANSELRAVSPAGASAGSIPLGASVTGSVVVLAGGDVAACDGSTLRRFGADGTPRWSTPPALGGIGLTPLVLAGGDATFVVPTRAGTIHAISDAGQEIWSGTLATGQELREGNVHSPAGASLGTAYFTSADGRLHAVIVDGRLDTSAPWPKAWHDPRNTGNAAAPF